MFQKLSKLILMKNEVGLRCANTGYLLDKNKTKPLKIYFIHFQNVSKTLVVSICI